MAEFKQGKIYEQEKVTENDDCFTMYQNSENRLRTCRLLRCPAAKGFLALSSISLFPFPFSSAVGIMLAFASS